MCCVPCMINFESIQVSANLEKLAGLHKMLRMRCVPCMINFESIQVSANLEKLDDLHKMLRKMEIQGIRI
jgi:hypothetical protein